jgi:tripartite-type tricarboxylate transporter receptor subunit TctC
VLLCRAGIPAGFSLQENHSPDPAIGRIVVSAAAKGRYRADRPSTSEETRMNLIKRVLAGCLLGLCAQMSALAADYPSRPVRLVVGYPPGGATDIIARLLQNELAPLLGQTVIVENRPGANGAIANRAVATAEPDGHTLLVGNPGPLVINPLLAPDEGVDPATTLEPVSQVTDGPLLILVRADSPIRTVGDIVDRARQNPGTLSFGSPGNGSPMQIVGEALQAATGTKMVHVPYRGSGPALVDLLGGTLDFLPDSRSSSRPHVRAGKLRAIAVTGLERLPEMPDVPTVAESGFPGFNVTTWLGILAPAGTPDSVIDTLHVALADVLGRPAVRQQIEELGATATGTTPSAFQDLLTIERETFGKLLRSAGLAPS